MNYSSKHESLMLNRKELLDILTVVSPSILEKKLTKEIFDPPTTKLDIIFFFDRVTENKELNDYKIELKNILEKIGIINLKSLVIHF